MRKVTISHWMKIKITKKKSFQMFCIKFFIQKQLSGNLKWCIVKISVFCYDFFFDSFLLLSVRLCSVMKYVMYVTYLLVHLLYDLLKIIVTLCNYYGQGVFVLMKFSVIFSKVKMMTLNFVAFRKGGRRLLRLSLCLFLAMITKDLGLTISADQFLAEL